MSYGYTCKKAILLYERCPLRLDVSGCCEICSDQQQRTGRPPPSSAARRPQPRKLKDIARLLGRLFVVDVRKETTLVCVSVGLSAHDVDFFFDLRKTSLYACL